MNLLGSAPSEHLQTLHSLYVTQIATLVWISEPETTTGSGKKGVVVGLALKEQEVGEELSENERDVFHGIMSLVRDMLKQPFGV